MSKTNLIDYAFDVHSQCGQDGILAKLFDLMNIKLGYCVEFGAWDGIRFSNTRSLLTLGWKGLLIETHPARFDELKALYEDRDDVTTVNQAVGLGKDSLDNILAVNGAPTDLDFVSIDIDSNDYYIWESLRQFKPKVVLIETNPYFPIFVEYIQPYDSKHLPLGASPLSLLLLGKSKGYTPVAYVGHDWLFVRDDQLPDIELPSAFEMLIAGGEIRGGEQLSCGVRQDLASGVAGTGFIDVAAEFASLEQKFSFEPGTHVKIRTSLNELQELL